MADDNTDTLDTGTGTDAPVDDRHSDIADAFDQVETESREKAPAAAPAAAPGAAPGERPEAAAPAGGDRARRGPDGKFLAGAEPAKKAAAAPEALGTTPGAKSPAAAQGKPSTPAAAASTAASDPTAASIRAPQSWKPQAREHWAKLPAEVRNEVIRRETEVGRAMQDSAKAREALGHVQEVLAPYTHNITASGTDVIGAIGNFFRADNTLRHGSTSDKASMVADIIKNYGVDITALDSVLAGQQVAPNPNEAMAVQLRQEMQAQLKPVLGYFNQMQGRREEALQSIRTNAGTEVQQFGGDEAHEFFEDVRLDMADIIDLYTQRGQPLTLQEAYDRAIMLNPNVREIVNARQEAARVNTQAAAAQRARRAAASVGGSPAPAGRAGPVGVDRRADIEAAWDQSSSS